MPKHETLMECVEPGDTYIVDGDSYWSSGIHVDEHFNRIICYGRTEEDADALRDEVLNGLRTILEAVKAQYARMEER